MMRSGMSGGWSGMESRLLVSSVQFSGRSHGFGLENKERDAPWTVWSKMLQPLCGNMFASSSSTKAAEAVA